MKRTIYSAFLLTIVVCVLLLSLIGCNQNLQTNVSKQIFSFDSFNQLNKVYIGESDGPIYETLDSYMESEVQERNVKGAIVKFHCVEITPYISISHQGDDIIVSGKTVVKCKIDTVAKEINGYELPNDKTIVIEQQYYFEPVSEADCMMMFETFGATFQTNQSGEFIGMNIADGDYALEIKENVNYVVKLREDVLPLCYNQYYYGLFLIANGKEDIKYFSPEDEEKTFASFVVSKNYSTIANEIRHYFSQQ